jgi:hypothetical protein
LFLVGAAVVEDGQHEKDARNSHGDSRVQEFGLGLLGEPPEEVEAVHGLLESVLDAVDRLVDGVVLGHVDFPFIYFCHYKHPFVV